jgi:hypothetical protein
MGEFRRIRVIFERKRFSYIFSPLSLQPEGPAPNGRFEFQKASQLFIGTHNEPLSIVAMCVCNPDRSPVGINR